MIDSGDTAGQQVIQQVWRDRMLIWGNRLVPWYSLWQIHKAGRTLDGTKAVHDLGPEFRTLVGRARDECPRGQGNPELVCKGLEEMPPSVDWKQYLHMGWEKVLDSRLQSYMPCGPRNVLRDEPDDADTYTAHLEDAIRRVGQRLAVR